ncbi:MAG: hypothetical protein H6606_02560 [Flavobacteriales bacterium]|nr:hypothetical protein [Flavobacteriales bacterium]
MIRKGFLLLLAFGLVQAKAQSLRIVYDFNKDDVRFYRVVPEKDDVEISQPVVGRNKMVKVEVVNFNKFVYAANCQFEASTSKESNTVNLMGMISPLIFPGGTQTFFTTMGGKEPEVGRGGLLSTRSASAAYDELQEAYTTLSALESSMNNLDYAIKKLNDLKYNPYLPTDTIKSMSDHLVEMVLVRNSVNPSDFSDLVLAYNDKYKSGVSELRKSSGNFLKACDEYANSRGGMQSEDQELKEYALSLQNRLNTFTQEISAQDITEKINTLEALYTSIKTTTFTFNASQMAKDDELEIKLNFYENPKEDEIPQTANLNAMDQLKKIKDKTLTVTVKGDMKINSSIGLGFPYFVNNESFVNRDSIITAQEGNNYSPNFAAYMNFYPYSGKIANLGGTFGIGLPLTTDNRTINMFMGLSALFGSDNRIALHAGATLGQLKVLDAGYQVNDKLLSATQEVPLRNIWQWGAFAGISFSLTELQK